MINDISAQRIKRDDLWQYQQSLEEQVALKTKELNAHYQKQKRVYFGFIMLLGTLSALLGYFVYRQKYLNKRYKDSTKQYQSLFNASSHIAMIAVDNNGL
jgi:type VI protein secretion system component VasF